MKRRCFSQSILQSDSFLDLSPEAQILYIHLNMEADDEGFINNARRIARMTGATEDHLGELIAQSFLLSFDSGVVVVKHWTIHNSIRNDRLKPTVYQEERAQLTIKDNGAYTWRQPNDNQMTTKWQPSDNQVADNWQTNDNQMADKCPHKLSKVNLSKDNLSKGKLSKEKNKINPLPHLFGEYSNVKLTMPEYDAFKKECPIADERINKLSAYISKTGKYKEAESHIAILRDFWNQDKGKEPSYNLADFEGYKKPVYKAN